MLPIHVAPEVVVPAAAISLRAVRASGPGGQNVNKVASKVELRVDLDRITGLDPTSRARLDALVARRRDASGRLLVTSQKTRDQSQNLEDARTKVRDLVARCLVAPRARRPTRATSSSREARLAGKKRLSSRKRARARVDPASE